MYKKIKALFSKIFNKKIPEKQEDVETEEIQINKENYDDPSSIGTCIKCKNENSLSIIDSSLSNSKKYKCKVCGTKQYILKENTDSLTLESTEHSVDKAA